MILPKFSFSNESDISPQIIEFKNLEVSKVLSSDFPGLSNLCNLIGFSVLSGLYNLTGLNSPVSLKNFLILRI